MEEVLFERGALKSGSKEHIPGTENSMCKESEAWQGMHVS